MTLSMYITDHTSSKLGKRTSYRRKSIFVVRLKFKHWLKFLVNCENKLTARWIRFHNFERSLVDQGFSYMKRI